MGDLIFKPATGGDLILQEDGGTAALTIDTDGNTEIAQNIEQADAKNIQTDQVRARDGDGLQLYDDGGSGIFVKDGGSVGIGTTAPASTAAIHFSHASEASTHGLQILNTVNANDGIAPIWFGVSDERNKAAIGLKRSTSYGVGDLIFAVDTDTNNADVTFEDDEKMRITKEGNVEVSTGNIVIGTAGKGIDFAAQTTSGAGSPDTDAGDEVLNHYETGSWTPIIGGSTDESGQGYTTQTGVYTKVGDLVCCEFYVTLSAKGTISGSATIGGLPFNAYSEVCGGGSIGYWGALGASARSVGLYKINSTDWAYLTFETSGSTAGSTSIQLMATAQISDTTRFNGTITFRTA